MSKIVECKSCKHKVDSTAKTCPSCGVASPGVNVSASGCLVVIIIIALTGYITNVIKNKSDQDAGTADTTIQQPTQTTIPRDVIYRIIDDESKRDIKRTVKVSLNKKVSEDVLREIAKSIKKNETHPHQRTFIVYFIEGDDKQGWWATTHFNPDLDVKIIGLSDDEEKRLTASQTTTSGKNK